MLVGYQSTFCLARAKRHLTGVCLSVKVQFRYGIIFFKKGYFHLQRDTHFLLAPHSFLTEMNISHFLSHFSLSLFISAIITKCTTLCNL
jgi:hypothetical protein